MRQSCALALVRFVFSDSKSAASNSVQDEVVCRRSRCSSASVELVKGIIRVVLIEPRE